MTASESNAPTKHTGIININRHLITSNCSCNRGIFQRLSAGNEEKGGGGGRGASPVRKIDYDVCVSHLIFHLLFGFGKLTIDLFSQLFLLIQRTTNAKASCTQSQG